MQPVEGGSIMYRGRAAVTLAPKAPALPWDSFDECPHEQLDDPGRLHLDPMGNLHLCQGLVMGNLFERPLKELVRSLSANAAPDRRPAAPGRTGGSRAALRSPARRSRMPTPATCATRRAWRCGLDFGEVLAPGQMYGEGLA